jgi:CxxC-x17-CxxC domain-containing protein
MGRVDMEEDLRKDFYLYVDEFQNFSTESFANILSEARKYRLNLILANQYVEQILETVRNAIFGNVGTIVSFRVGAMDAEFLEKEFMPVFVQNDIVNLPKYNVYLKLMIDGIAGDAFSAQVLPPVYLGDTEENEQKIIAISRERYASSKEEVEDKISRWAGIMPAGGFPTVNGPAPANSTTPYQGATVYRPQAAQNSNFAPARQVAPAFSVKKPEAAPISQVPAQQVQPVATVPVAAPAPSVSSPEPVRAPESQKLIQGRDDSGRAVAPIQAADDLGEYNQPEPPKPLFEAICDMCGDQIQVPFQPDGKRPTFCKDCLKDYQRMTAKEKLNQERKMQREQEERATSAPMQQQSAAGAPQQNSPQRPVGNPAPIATAPKQAPSKQQYQKPERKIEPKSYAPQDRPMSLSQMSHIAPKKFKPRQRPEINLDEVRSMINSTRSTEEK